MNLFEHAEQYPHHPGHKARDTAENAAKAIAPTSQILRAQCVTILEREGTLTADEAARMLDKSILSIRPRFSELARMNRIKDTGMRRCNASNRMAIVWALS